MKYKLTNILKESGLNEETPNMDRFYEDRLAEEVQKLFENQFYAKFNTQQVHLALTAFADAMDELELYPEDDQSFADEIREIATKIDSLSDVESFLRRKYLKR